MMRVAATNVYREGFKLIGIVHDALLIECDDNEAEYASERLKQIMRLSSAAVLMGCTVDVDVVIVRWPDRYMDDGGIEMWTWVMEELAIAEAADDLKEAEKPKHKRKTRVPSP
jgi:DNA polymerase-1